jgi:hypothetical protein
MQHRCGVRKTVDTGKADAILGRALLSSPASSPAVTVTAFDVIAAMTVTAAA